MRTSLIFKNADKRTFNLKYFDDENLPLSRKKRSKLFNSESSGDSSHSKSRDTPKIQIIYVFQIENGNITQQNTTNVQEVISTTTTTVKPATTVKPVNVTNNKTKRSLPDHLTENSEIKTIPPILKTNNFPMNLRNIFVKLTKGINKNNNHTNDTDHEKKDKNANTTEHTTKIIPSFDGDFVGPFGYNPTPMPLIPISINPEYYNYYNFSYIPQIPDVFNYSSPASPYGSLPPISNSPFPNIMKTVPQIFNMTMWANVPNVIRTIYNLTRINSDLNNPNYGSALYRDEGAIRFE